QDSQDSQDSQDNVLQLLEELKNALEEERHHKLGESMGKKKDKCKVCKAFKELSKGVNTLHEELTALKAQIAGLKAQQDLPSQAEIERLQNELSAEDKEDLKQEVADLKKQLGTEQQQHFVELNNLRAELEGENGQEGLRAQRDKFKDELEGKEGEEGLRAKYQRLENELKGENGLRAQCQKLTAELDGENGQEGLRTRCEKLKTERDQLDTELNGENGVRKQLQQANNEKQKLETQLTQKQGEYNKLNEELTIANRAKETLNGQLTQARSANDTLNKEKQDLKNQLKEAKAYEEEAKSYKNLSLVHLLNLAKGSDRLLERLEINKNATLDDLFVSQLGQDRLFVLKCIAEDIQHFREDLPKIQPLIAFFNALFSLLESSTKITRLQVQEGDSYNAREHATPEARQPSRGKIAKVHFVGYKQGSNIFKSLVEVIN
ncbi:coiled-coil domain-containing protein, partial [Helicobacter felis]|uniref:hypothetical protein n=3 Tax=Helicobacter felis TaxID=214 RepID=UPI0013155E59